MENKNNLLSDTEAAYYLGITKELLFAYVQNAPKKHKGENRKLNSIVIEGENYFTQDELDSFNAYLIEPWSESSEQRPLIPSYIKEYLKVEAEGICPISGKGYPLEYAHIVPYNESLNHYHHNIIRIAEDVHTKIDNGVISRDLLIQTKNRLVTSIRNKLIHATKINDPSFQVPPPHPIYIGRENELSELIQSMECEQLIILEGIGGIGKTQLLIQALYNVRYNNPVIWLDLDSVSSFSDFLMILNNSVAQYVNISAHSESIIEALRETQITFIFDSLEKLLIHERDEIEDFINKLLLNAPGVQLFITCQVDLSLLDFPGIIFEIKGLAPEESISFIEELAGNNIIIPETDLQWILNFCNGHPLTIKLIVTLIKYYKSPTEVIRILDTSAKVEHPTRNKQNKQTSLSICLNTIYHILSQEQKTILHYLKFYPGGLKEPYAAQQFENTPFLKNKAELQQFFFIETFTDPLQFERIYIPNPIRPFLKEKAEKEETATGTSIEKEAITNIMLEAVYIDSNYIETEKDGSLAYGIMRLENELPNLLSAFNIARKRALEYEKSDEADKRDEYLKIIAFLSSSMGKFYFTRSYYQEGSLFAQVGIKAYITLKNYTQAAMQYMYLAQIQSRIFDIKGLQETSVNLEKLEKQTLDISVKIKSLWVKGILDFETNRYNDSRKNLIEASKLLEKELEKEEDQSEFGNLQLLKISIAKTYEYENKFAKAIPIYKEALDNLTKKCSLENTGSFYHHYAYCMCKNGNWQEGINYYYLAIENFSKTGQFEYIGNSISDLGIFIEDHSEIMNHPILNERTFSIALGALNNQLSCIPNLKEQINNNPDIVPIPLLGKILLLIKAISFSPYSSVLCDWAAKTREEFSIDTSSYFAALLNLAHCVGGVNEWKNDTDAPKWMINSILQCSLIINGGPDLKSQTRVFYWLAQWMKFYQLQPNATAESLWKQAINSLKK